MLSRHISDSKLEDWPSRLAAGVLLAALSPLLLLVALVIWLENDGPILFRQVRSGRHGETFLIYKFRTLRIGSDGLPHARRATPIGRVLRRLGLDELPQLLNIARGEMSFVGPRPTVPDQVMRYSRRQRRRLDVKPGITGWAQVNGRNAIDWPSRIDLDLWYIEHRSVALDVRILIKTVPAILSDDVYGHGGHNPDLGEPSPTTMARAA